jgi:hypothetical protein
LPIPFPQEALGKPTKAQQLSCSQVPALHYLANALGAVVLQEFSSELAVVRNSSSTYGASFEGLLTSALCFSDLCLSRLFSG